MADWLEFTVRFLHIFFGVGWVGGAVYSMHIMMTGLRKLPPQIGGPATGMVVRKSLTFYAVAGPLTILFGVWNQYLMAGELAFQGTTWNVLLGASLVVALLMLGIGFGHNMPTFRKMEALAAKNPAAPEVLALRKRMMMGGIAVTLLGIVALGLMVGAVLTRSGLGA